MPKLSSLLSLLSSRVKLVVFMNLFFFGGVFVTALMLGFLLPPQLYEGPPAQFSATVSGSLILTVLSIFVFNLIVSAFVIITLPGFVLFPLSAAFLVYRAFIWGVLIYESPNWVFLIALPTLVLEGEGYVFAAVAGTLVGISWIKPKWVCKAESVSRAESLKKALRECAWAYVFVMMFLFIAAIVETAALALI